MAFSSPSSQNGLFPQLCSSSWARSHRHLLAQARAFLSSKTKHYIVLALVAMDVASIVADIFVALIACDLEQEGAEWVAETREGLHAFGMVVSSLFLVELAGMIWAFGAGFFEEWFHWLDATVIVASFAVDVVMLVLHGDGIEEIAGLIIVLRLWRLIKIIEELSIGVSEGMEQMRKRVEELERENIELKRGATDQLQAHEV
ncbi:hypothetical protein QBC32DRAFT_334469 [Pseudoneurospora amorphoporcata]|uniref:Voltage-gated hydrogen channel 1 n=1 Tax=Pseudoneurospora amorphoporcata TaxID=241081 RepID=A0AAN6NZZ9_9PEZI|nr:hypothetical protein QBC32DRAFT_334469 [Pseudoneurospora amorphoporcata]